MISPQLRKYMVIVASWRPRGCDPTVMTSARY